MKRLLVIGVVLGFIATLGLAWTAPFLQIERVRSITKVQPNGGRLEVFEIRVAEDRLMQLPGFNGSDDTYPAASAWSSALAPFSGEAQLFRLRDEDGEIIGTASRVLYGADQGAVEWVLNLPARGTAVLQGRRNGSGEIGSLILGVEQFKDLRGSYRLQTNRPGVWRLSTVVQAMPGTL